MIKSIIKEVFIIILLIVAITLILGILFYDYRPSTKKIPTKVAEYSLPKEMQEELSETIQSVEQQNIVKTYRVDGDDLDRYERSDDYVKGKINPFERYTSTVDKENTNTTNDNNSTNNNNTNNTNNTNNNTNNENTSSTGTGTQGNFLNTVK